MMTELALALNGLAIVLAAWLAYLLGRRAAKKDRLREHELSSIADTRDRLLDVVRYADAFGRLEPEGLREFQKALRSLRYGRARTALVADDTLINLMATALPQVAETFPDTDEAVRTDVSRLGNVVREAMFEQESRVLRDGKPRMQSKEQQDRVDSMIAALQAQLPRYQGWRQRTKLAWRVWWRLTFG